MSKKELIKKVVFSKMAEENQTHYSHNLPTMYQNKLIIPKQNDRQLEAYLQEVLANNNDLKALSLTKASLALDMKVTRKNIYPMGSFSLNESKTKQGKSPLQSSRTMGITMQWDLDIWGKLSDEYDASKEAYFSMEHRYLNQRRILLENATIDWINYWYLTQVIKNQKELLSKYANLSRHYLETSNAGLRDRYFYLESRRTQELIQNTLFATELDLVKIRQQLNVYRGLAPHTPLLISIKKNIAPLHLNKNKMNPMQRYISQRYDVKQALGQLKATEFLEKASYKALLPQLNISLSSSKSSLQSFSKLLSRELLWEFVGGITQPVFHAEQLKLMAEQKSIESAIAWRTYQEVVLKALLEVEVALETDASLKQQLLHKERFYTNLLRSLEGSKEKALEGIADFADYLQEEANAIDEKNNLLGIQTEYIKNRLRLMSALGFDLVEDKNKER